MSYTRLTQTATARLGNHQQEMSPIAPMFDNPLDQKAGDKRLLITLIPANTESYAHVHLQ